MLIPLGSSTTFRLLLLKQFEDIKSKKMIFAKALCVVLLSYSASFGDSQSLKNDTDSGNRTVIYLPPAPQFEQNPNDVVLRTKKMIGRRKLYTKMYLLCILLYLKLLKKITTKRNWCRMRNVSCAKARFRRRAFHEPNLIHILVKSRESTAKSRESTAN